MSDLPDPTAGSFRPAGPARGEDISPSKEAFQQAAAFVERTKPPGAPPSITYEPPPEKPTMETWDDRKRERLRRYLVRTIGAASSIEDAANLIAENFESGVALGGTPDPFGPGGDPGARSPASRAPKSVCGACGALVTEDEEDQP